MNYVTCVWLLDLFMVDLSRQQNHCRQSCGVVDCASNKSKQDSKRICQRIQKATSMDWIE